MDDKKQPEAAGPVRQRFTHGRHRATSVVVKKSVKVPPPEPPKPMTAEEWDEWEAAEAGAYVETARVSLQLEQVGKLLLPAIREPKGLLQAANEIERKHRQAEAQQMNEKGIRSPATADSIVTLTKENADIWLIANLRHHDPTHVELKNNGGPDRMGKDFYTWERYRVVVSGLGVRRKAAVWVSAISIWERLLTVEACRDGEMLLPLRSTHVRLELVERSVGRVDVTVDRQPLPPAFNPDDPDDVLVVPDGWLKRQIRSATKPSSPKRSKKSP